MDIGEGLTREERETLISFNDADDTATITTASPIFARKLTVLCASLGVEVETRSAWCVRAVVPLGCLRLNKPVRLSDAERERRATVMRERRVRQLAQLT